MIEPLTQDPAVHGLQGEILAGELPTESGREHGLGGVADTQDVLFAQLVCRQVAGHVDAAKRQDSLKNHLEKGKPEMLWEFER